MVEGEQQRVALIIPGSLFLADARVFIHLGMLRIAAVLENAGYPVDVIDLSGVQNYEAVIRDYFRATPTRLVGLTGTSPQMPCVSQLCSVIRQEQPEAKLLLGGPHPTVVNAAKKREQKKGIVSRAHTAYHRLFDLADVVVAGDGEDTIEAALQAPPGTLLDADDPESIGFLSRERLSELPFAARHLVDLSSYHYYIDGERSTSLIMQLGCPWACRFCAGRYSPSYRRMRLRSSESVVAELRHLYEVHGFKAFQLYDDELNASPTLIDTLKAIIALQEELKVSFKFRGFIKSHVFTAEQAQYLKECGFVEICIGFESGADRILQNIKKQASKSQNSRSIAIAKRAGLRTKAFMSFSHPGESEATARETCEWLIAMEVEDFDCSLITPFPGCPFYDDAVVHDAERGIWVYRVPENGDALYCIDTDYTTTTQYYKGDKNLGYTSYVYTDFLSVEDTVRLRDWIEDTVRQKLNIPYYQTKAALLYDHSCGQIPLHILRSTASALR